MSNPLDKEPYSMFKIDIRKEIRRLERKQNKEKRKETKLGNIKRIIKSL